MSGNRITGQVDQAQLQQLVNIGQQIDQEEKLEAICMSCITLIFIIILAFVLNVYDGDCGNVRLWLHVILWAHVVLVAVIICCGLACAKGLGNLFSLVWFIVGNVWYHQDESKYCQEFQVGKKLMLVLLIISWATYSILILAAFYLCFKIAQQRLQQRESAAKAQEDVVELAEQVQVQEV